MIPTVHVDRGHRGQGRYALTDTGSGHVWGVCAEVEGLFREPLRGTYELFGWVPDGAEVPRGWVGSRVWLVPEDRTLDAWLLEDAESLGQYPGTDGLVLTGLDDYVGPPEGHRGLSDCTTGTGGSAPAGSLPASYRPSKWNLRLSCGARLE